MRNKIRRNNDDLYYLQYMYNLIFTFCILYFCLCRSALLCEMEQRLKELNPESGNSNVGAIALRRSLP